MTQQGSKYGTIGLPQAAPSKYGTIGLKPPHEPTAGEYATAAGASLVQGATGMVGGAISGVGRLAEAIDPYFPEWFRSKGGLVSAGKSISSIGGELGHGAIESVKKGGGAGEFLAVDVPQALGSGAGALAFGGGAGALMGRAAGVAAIGASSVGAQASEGYEDAIAAGASPEVATRAAVLNAPSGLLEVVPGLGVEAKIIRRIAGRVSAPLGKIITTALLDVPGEMVTESVQRTLGNLVAGENGLDYDDRKLFEGALRDGSAAGLSAFILSALGGKAGSMAAARVPTADRPAPTSDNVSRGTSEVPVGAPAQAPGAVGPTTPTQTAEDRVIASLEANNYGAGEVAQETPPPAPTPEQTRSVEGLTARLPEGTRLRIVPPTTPEDTFLTELAEHRGTRLTLVESEDGSPLPLPAAYQDGVIVLDRNAAPGQARRAVVYHELLHGLRDRAGESWDSLFADIERIDPTGLAQAAESYAADYERAAGRPLPDAIRAEEGLSRRAETLGAWLDMAVREPNRIAAALDQDRTFRERIRDEVSRLLEVFGVRIDNTLQKRLKELVRDLGKPPTGDAKQSAELAQRFAYAINALSGMPLVEQAAPVADKNTPARESATEAAAQIRGLEAPATETGTGGVPTQRGGIQGSESAVELADETSIPARYVAVEAEDLIPSHDPRRGFARNEKGDKNERDYGDPSEGRPYRDTVERIAASPKPGLLLSDNPTATDGPPITTDDFRVLGGNARSMAMQLAYSRGGKQADTIRSAAQAAAKKFGLDEAAVAGLRNPVIVRVIPKEHAGKQGELSRILNAALTTAKTQVTDAVSRGSKITPSAATKIANALGDGTLAEALNSESATATILQALVESGAWAQADVTAMLEGRGLLSKSGRDIVEQTLLGAVVPSIRTLAELQPSTRTSLVRALPSLVRIRTAYTDFPGILSRALDAVVSTRQSGQETAVNAAKQMSLVEEEWKSDDAAIALADALIADTSKTFAAKAASLADEVHDIASGQGALFSAEKRTPESAFKERFGKKSDKNAEGKGRQDEGGSDSRDAPGQVGLRFAVPAYHGSPHSFDEFKSERIGSGEGAQAYGYGLYFTDKKEIAQHYQRGLSRKALIEKARDAYSPEDSDPDEALDALLADKSLSDSQRELLSALQDDGWFGFDYPHQAVAAALSGDFDNLDPSDRTRAAVAKVGALYQVELAPEQDEFLLWDEPISKQSEKVKAALAKFPRFQGPDDSGGQAYLSISARLGMKYREERGLVNGERHGDRLASTALRSEGVRGIKYLDGSSRSKGEGAYNYVIFDDKDVKITLRFAVTPTPGQPGGHYDIPDETRVEEGRRYVQDYLTRSRKLGKVTGVAADYTQDIEAMPSRVRELIERARKMGQERIRKLLEQHGITLAEFGEYAYALHAPDANALAKRRHPRKFGSEENPGSGMRNSEAAEIVAKVNADPRAAGFKELAGVMRAVGKKKLDVLVSSGLLNEEQRAQWERELGPNYINLKEFELDPVVNRVQRRKGFGARGKESFRREGRRSKADYEGVIVNTLAQLESAIIRAEHNAVGQAVGDWVRKVDDNRIASFATVPRQDENDIFQEVSRRPSVQPGEALFVYKEKGHEVYVVIRDPAKDRAGVPLLARALNRMGVVGGSEFMRAMSAATAFWRLTRTTLSPEWLISNAQVDLLDATVTLQREGKGFARKVWRGMPKAIAATWNAAHGSGKRTEWSDLRDQAAEDGAFTGYYDYKDTQTVLNELRGGLESKSVKQQAKAVADWVTAATSSFEEATRLSIYAAAIEKGKTSREAARIARETTTPFMRKGEWGTGIGMAYIFANASIQSNVIALRAMKTKGGRIALGALTFFSWAMIQLSRAILGDDEYEKTSDWATRIQNIELGIPGTKATLKWKASRTYMPFHVAAVGLDALAHGEITPGFFASEVLKSIVDAGVPVDTSGSALQSLLPTMAQPLAQVETNKGFRGRPINPEYPNDRRPDSAQAFSSASPEAKAIAKALNSLTGGDDVKEGFISIKPGTLETYAKFLGGGTGTFMGRVWDFTERSIKGQETYVDDIPLVRKLVSGENKREESTPFYETVRKVQAIADNVNDYYKAGQPEKAAAIKAENPELWRLRLLAKAKHKLVTDLREQLNGLPEDSPKRAELEARIEAIMADFNRRAKADKAGAAR